MRPVPVLMYHHVNPHSGDDITVTPEIFESQMRYLNEAGFSSLRIDELLSNMETTDQGTEKGVVVTFDDGWRDNFEFAFPILERYRIRASLFVVTDWTAEASRGAESSEPVPRHEESERMVEQGDASRVILSWSRIRQMENSGWVEAYSHTRTHPRCVGLDEEQLVEELRGSKTAMEQELNRSCSHLCWPYGAFDERSMRLAEEAGYHCAFSTTPGAVVNGVGRFRLNRIGVKNNLDWFERRMKIYSHPVGSRVYPILRRLSGGGKKP